MNIADIKKVDLKPGDTLVVTVDCGNMPPSRRKQYLTDIANHWKSVFTDPSINIIAVPTIITLSIIGNGSSIQQPVNTPTVADTQSDYDRAMGIIK